MSATIGFIESTNEKILKFIADFRQQAAQPFKRDYFVNCFIDYKMSSYFEFFLWFSILVYLISPFQERPLLLSHALLCSVVGVVLGIIFLFLVYASDIIFIILVVATITLVVLFFLLFLSYEAFFVGLDAFLVFIVLLCLFSFFIMKYLSFFYKALKTLWKDFDRQAHFLFLLSMATLAYALWLQNGGNWHQMARLNVPIFEIPWTESLGFPLAIVGFVHDPVGSAVSSVVQASANQTLVIILAAVALFALAENRLHQSAVGVRPKFAALVFALLVVSVCLEIALHAAGAPDLPSVLILFNRAIAVLALGVYLFWRRVAKNGEPVRGADGEFRKACDYAEKQALKIALWLLGLVWLATQLSHGFPNGFPPLVLSAFGIAASVPFVWIVNFKREFDNQLGHYNEALRMQRASYEPPPISASDDEIRRALGDEDEDKDAPP